MSNQHQALPVSNHWLTRLKQAVLGKLLGVPVLIIILIASIQANFDYTKGPNHLHLDLNGKWIQECFPWLKHFQPGPLINTAKKTTQTARYCGLKTSQL